MSTEVTEPAPKPKKKQYGFELGSPEWRTEMERRRAERIANGDTRAKGGRDRKATREEAKEQALEKLVPRAIKELEKQLSDEDPKIRQTAAIKILEWGKGKPRQTVENVGEQTTVIRYETGAIGSAN